MTYDRGDEKKVSFKKGMAHEIAHLWWHGAPADSWEDWRNESFAEFSALLEVRRLFGDEQYLSLIEKYSAETKDAPPIWGINRGHEAAYKALYRKGAILLHDLSQAIGANKFLEFCRALLSSRPDNTKGLLDILASITSKGVRGEFERRLRT